MPATMPNKHLRPSPTQNNESELTKKQRKPEKEGWFKMLSRGSFHPPADLSVTYCSQHIIVGCSCRY
eukprot:7026905-Ditylum_brightwellii.AAC.1